MNASYFATAAMTAIACSTIGLSHAGSFKHIHIQKEVLIEGSLEEVFEQVVHLKNFPNWSPFYEEDPAQKIEVKGTDGEVGAQYHWEGKKGKDLGFQEIKEIKPLKYVKMGCDIQKPFTANPVFEYTFTQVGNAVKVTQDFNLHSKAMDAFFMRLFGARKDMERLNARGLELLKRTVEK